MVICPALRGIIRPPHRLGGVAKSRSLFVATPPLIPALLDKKIQGLDEGERIFFPGNMKKKLAIYPTGQVVAAYS